jgi:hypothetical protein
LEGKSAKKLDVWQGGSMSMGRWGILINGSLSSSSISHMSMFLMQKNNYKKLGQDEEEILLARWFPKEKISPGQVDNGVQG